MSELTNISEVNLNTILSEKNMLTVVAVKGSEVVYHDTVHNEVDDNDIQWMLQYEAQFDYYRIYNPATGSVETFTFKNVLA